MKDALFGSLLLATTLFLGCGYSALKDQRSSLEDDENRAEVYAREKIEFYSDLQIFEDSLAHGSSYRAALAPFRLEHCHIDDQNRILVIIDLFTFDYSTLDSVVKYGGNLESRIQPGVAPTYVRFYVPPESLRSLALIYNIKRIRIHEPPPPVTY